MSEELGNLKFVGFVEYRVEVNNFAWGNSNFKVLVNIVMAIIVVIDCGKVMTGGCTCSDLQNVVPGPSLRWID